VVEVLRKGTALLSVLLLLTAFRCMANCIVNDTSTATSGSAHNSSSTVPPCHRHNSPTQGRQAPCQSHPGLLAYSVHQPSAHVDVPVNLLAVVYEPAPLPGGLRAFGLDGFAHTPPLLRTDALSSIVLRI
jgi:hypothetical protein